MRYSKQERAFQQRLVSLAAGLAHQMRNPLNAAHLQLRLVEKRLGTSRKNLQAARLAAEAASFELQRLERLVEEFLQFAHPLPLKRMTADIQATVDSALAGVAEEASHRQIAIDRTPGPAVVGHIDAERMKQALLCILRNAVEATQAHGHVRVKVRQHDGDGAVVRVEDNGPGIVAKESDVFEPFYTTKEGRTGLGLAIAQRIVADHGGRITVSSRPGQTVFAIRLRCASVL